MSFVSRFLAAVSTIIRIDADAVTADNARIERNEFQLVFAASMTLTDGRELVHECDVEVALATSRRT
jgi:hypothetical protein